MELNKTIISTKLSNSLQITISNNKYIIILKLILPLRQSRVLEDPQESSLVGSSAVPCYYELDIKYKKRKIVKTKQLLLHCPAKLKSRADLYFHIGI